MKVIIEIRDDEGNTVATTVSARIRDYELYDELDRILVDFKKFIFRTGLQTFSK